MGRKYFRKTNTDYDLLRRNVERAFSAWQKGDSIRRAAEMYGISKSTLMDAIKRSKTRGPNTRNEGAHERNEGVAERNDSGPKRKQGEAKRNDGGPKRNEGVAEKNDGGSERNEGEAERNDSGSEGNEGGAARNDGRPKRNEGRAERNDGGPNECDINVQVLCENVLFVPATFVTRQVFKKEMETKLGDYLQNMSKMFYGLTTVKLRGLAYEYAKANQIDYPKTWEQHKSAGKDWFRGFLSRYGKLSIRRRTPEKKLLEGKARLMPEKMDKISQNVPKKLVRIINAKKRINFNGNVNKKIKLDKPAAGAYENSEDSSDSSENDENVRLDDSSEYLEEENMDTNFIEKNFCIEENKIFIKEEIADESEGSSVITCSELGPQSYVKTSALPSIQERLTMPGLKENYKIEIKEEEMSSCGEVEDPLSDCVNFSSFNKNEDTSFVKQEHTEGNLKSTEKSSQIPLKPNDVAEMQLCSVPLVELSEAQMSRWGIDITKVNIFENDEPKRKILKLPKHKLFNCSKCPFFCGDFTDFGKHLRSHTSHKRKKKFRCDYCSFSSNNKSNFSNHVRIHTGDKPFSCDLCTYSAVRKDSLKKHKTTHTGEKPFSCSICSFSFSVKCALVRHMKLHTGEKPVKCNFCSFSSARHYSLKIHMRTHTGEKPFSCNLCTYSSSHKPQLVRHMRTHTGEKSFHCEVCSRSFADNQRLKEHMRTHTGENPTA